MNGVGNNPFFVYKINEICAVCLRLLKNKRTSGVRDKLPVTSAPEFCKLLESISLFKYVQGSDQKLCATCCFKLLNIYEFQQLCNLGYSHFENYIRHTNADARCTLEMGATPVNIQYHDSENIPDATPSTFEIHNNTTENELVTANSGPFKEQDIPNIEKQFSKTFRETEIQAADPPILQFTNAPQKESQYLGVSFIQNDANCISPNIMSLRTEVSEMSIFVDNNSTPYEMTETFPRALPVTELKTEAMEIDNSLHPIDSGPDPLDIGVTAVSGEIITECSSRNENGSNGKTDKEPEIMRKEGDRYKCRFCNLTCSVEYVDVHLAWHEKIKASCGTCKISFPDVNKLKEHIELRPHSCRQSETDLHKLYQCEYCFKLFAAERYYIAHAKGIVPTCKKNTCKYCGKVCQGYQDLTNHERIHTGEKPFSCAYCDKSFASPSQLKQHMRVHSDLLPFGCEKCGENFRNNKSLRAHMKTQHFI